MRELPLRLIPTDSVTTPPVLWLTGEGSRVDEIVELVLSTSGDPIAYLVLGLLVICDGLLPIVPSETTAVAFSALVRSNHPELFGYLLLVVWGGAWIGDNLAFFVGHNRWLRQSRLLKGPTISKALHWAHQKFAQRGVVIIIIGRFLPVFRVAVNITAGMVGVRWSRFLALSSVTSAAWTSYIVGSGWVAGHWFRVHPVMSIVAAAAVSTVIGWVVDKAAQRLVLRRHPDKSGLVDDEEPYEHGARPKARTERAERVNPDLA